MKFLVDRCAGRRVALWLREKGHDVTEVIGPDPGDLELLERAGQENRVLITLDKHFAQLLFRRSQVHPGLIRLPDVPAAHRILLLERVLSSHSEGLSRGAIIAVRGERIRVSLSRTEREE